MNMNDKTHDIFIINNNIILLNNRMIEYLERKISELPVIYYIIIIMLIYKYVI